jgi:hypothetical protein
MSEHDHEERTSAAPRPRRPVEAEAASTPEHPLLELQHRAGNAAVAQLIALQRHSLNPDEEAG